MPLPDPHATAFVVYNSDNSREQVIVLHFFQVGTFAANAVEAFNMATVLDATVGPLLKNAIAVDSAYVRVTVQLNVGGVVFDVSVDTTRGGGNIGTESLPDYVAAIIRKQTAVGGRRGRGRFFIGCIAETQQDTGVLTAGGLTTLDALGDGLRADLVTAAGTWRSAHYSRADNTMVAIVDTKAQKFLATQRRRRLRRAP